mmetsp:Transcript_7696/g.10943  ORF Transcript_7696/g.10943 Transcript_7696/m.10943 type:complete len:239 (-) Transcript_7696:197-913(-)
MHVLVTVKAQVHPWIRLNRVIRDIPKEYIMGGNPVTNLRQLVELEMKKKGFRCRCIRCRECKGNHSGVQQAILVDRRYKSSGGTEVFLSFESKDKETIFAFLRLRLCRPKKPAFPELKDAALLRELHTYGQMRPVGDGKGGRLRSKDEKAQHMGFGRRLIQKAEYIARENKFKRIAVIAGIGTREYYAKWGYHLDGTYMVKNLGLSIFGVRTSLVRAIFVALLPLFLAYIVHVMSKEM